VQGMDIMYMMFIICTIVVSAILAQHTSKNRRTTKMQYLDYQLAINTTGKQGSCHEKSKEKNEQKEGKGKKREE